jgi:two-component system, cell cycle sensor histidine kinase PleC
LALLLAGKDEPAFAIDPGSAAIIAANSAGLNKLGLAATASLPVTLDAASPAVARLRQIASGPETKFSKPETLMFWIGGRLARLTCQTRVIRDPSRALVLISPVDDRVDHPVDRTDGASNVGSGVRGGGPETNLEPNGHKAIDSIADGESASGEALPPPRARNDAETLKAIARVIRERRLYKPPPQASSRKPACSSESRSTARILRAWRMNSKPH